jgi:hypothetical protein
VPRAPYSTTPGDDLVNADGSHSFTSTAATATAGGGQAALATVAGYLVITVNGVQKKVPYFNV